MAIGMSAVLGISGATVMLHSTAGNGSASRSKADRLVLSLAEAGLNNALATLNASVNPTVPTAVPQQSATYEGGTATWYGTLGGNVWTLTGIGRVANPTGPGSADVVRTVSARARAASSGGSGTNSVWNHLYADDTTSCLTLRDQINVNVPLYARGSLCMQDNARVTGPRVHVGGTVTLNDGSSIGNAGAPVGEVHVAGGCRAGVGALHDPCGPAEGVYGTLVDSQPSGLSKPAVDLAYWYQNAQPGPVRGCTTGSFPGGFDNDTVLNRSLPAPANLTPSFAYDCTVRDGSGNVVGRIAWTPGPTGTPGSLVVSGTIFIDGNIIFSDLVNAVYQGPATIYASGTITFNDQIKICAVAGCGSWDASQNLLAFVAGSSTDATGVLMRDGVTFQGAIYAVNDIVQLDRVTVWGPLVARQLYLRDGVFNYVPIGTVLPGMPGSTSGGSPIVLESGSWSS